MGVVYRARDPIIDRVLALKTIDLALSGAALASFEERFFLEARSAGRLNHPNIVTIYDAGKAESLAYIAMEFLKGTSLRAVLDGQPPLTIVRIVEIAAQVARGLAYAHEHGVIHRDVKPANIMLLETRRAKITDFGIARLGETDGFASECAGSPRYMSPEQIRREPALDGRSDIFALGTVLYEMLTGKQPFTGANVGEIMHQVLETEPLPPTAVSTRVAPELDPIVMRMLAKRPEDRFSSARALFRILRRCEKELGAANAIRQDGAPAVRIARRTSNGEDNTLEIGTPPALKRTQPSRSLRRFALITTGVAAIAAVALVPLRLQLADANATRGDPIPAPPIMAAMPQAAPPAMPAEGRTEDPVPPSPSPKRSIAAPQRPMRKPAVLAPAPAPLETEPVQAAAPPVVASIPPKEIATFVLAISPWGEVYVDGKPYGTVPPLTSIDVSPGRHRVEIRNASQRPYQADFTLQAGDLRRIWHDFE